MNEEQYLITFPPSIEIEPRLEAVEGRKITRKLVRNLVREILLHLLWLQEDVGTHPMQMTAIEICELYVELVEGFKNEKRGDFYVSPLLNFFPFFAAALFEEADAVLLVETFLQCMVIRRD